MLACAGKRALSWLPAAAASSLQCCRSWHTTGSSHDLRDFLDPQVKDSKAKDDEITYGRAWSADELRRKSFEDLHKLWVVCLKERNLLLTQMAWHRHPEQQEAKRGYEGRYRKVKLTMNRIKQVLSQRAGEQSNPMLRVKMKQVINMR